MKVKYFLILLFPLLGSALLGQEQALSIIKSGENTFKITADLKWQTLRIRVDTPEIGQTISINQNLLLNLIDSLLTEHEAFLKKGNFESFFMGRVVEFPWLKEYLIKHAESSAEWDANRGRLKKDHLQINKWVARLLFQHPLFKEMAKRFKTAGYAVTGLSVEKVLVTDLSKIKTQNKNLKQGKYPFDAQLWVLLEKQK